MSVVNILWRTMKWRYHYPITIVMSILQPMIWLLLYSTVAGHSMAGTVGGNYTTFILPGLFVLVIFSSSSSSGMANYSMKAGGSFYRIQISPIKRSAIVLGQVLESVCLSFIEVAILFLLGLFLSVRIETGFGGLLLILFLLLLTALFSANITFTLSLLLPNADVFFTVMNTIVLPIFFVSTALFPLESISGGLKAVVLLNPFTHIINSVRSLMSGTAVSWQSTLFAAVLFIMLCCLSFYLAVRTLEKDGKQ